METKTVSVVADFNSLLRLAARELTLLAPPSDTSATPTYAELRQTSQ